MSKEKDTNDTEMRKWDGETLFSIIFNVLLSAVTLFFSILFLLNPSDDIHITFFGLIFLSFSIILLFNAAGFILGKDWERIIEKYLMTGWFWALVIYACILWYLTDDFLSFIFGSAVMIFFGLMATYEFWCVGGDNRR